MIDRRTDVHNISHHSPFT